MVLLSSEEIEELSTWWLDAAEEVDRATTVAKSQLKQVMEWGEERCPHPSTFDGQCLNHKRMCPECWQALKKEAGL